MTKFRLTLTATMEYGVNPKNYPDKSMEGMLAIDIKDAMEDPMLIFDSPCTQWEVSGELIQ